MRFHAVLVSLLVSAGVAGPAAATTIDVSPTGGDDTANVQAALDQCKPGCTVQLGAGTFHIGQVFASDFRGALRGMGRGRTVLEALPHLPVNDSEPWPWAASPTPSAPWPVLIAFVDGSFTVSDLTVRIPISPATEPWFIAGRMMQELIAIMVTGDRADASFERVDVEGAAGSFFGHNVIFGIAYEGILAVADPSMILPQRPLTGSFSVARCAMRSVSLGILMYNVREARGTIAHNASEHVDIAYLLNEAAETDFEITHNSGREVFDTAVRWMQGFVAGYAGPSRAVIAHNRFEVSNGGVRGSADGIDLIDGGPTKTARVEVLDNHITLQTSAAAAPLPLRGGIFVTGLRDALVRGNRVEGPAPRGIALSGAHAATVRDNHVRGVTQDGIAVLSGSSANTVLRNHVHESGAFDLLWDGSGTGNAFVANHCATSDPPGLCARP